MTEANQMQGKTGVHSQPPPIGIADSKTAICTLSEGDYHLGLAAFVNSLVRAEYSGTIWAGYRGPLPPWVGQLPRVNGNVDCFTVSERIRLSFVSLTTRLHLTNYKPQFMLDLLAGPASNCEFIWYFDPDIFLRCKWLYFDDWQRYGIALCQEAVSNVLPPDSPLRHKWMEVAAGMGLKDPRPLTYYFNGGMVGLARKHASFLHLWRAIIERSKIYGCDLERMQQIDHESPFHANDQDALNLAAMYSEHPLSTMGPEAMGFVRGGFTMYHAAGPKPWRGSALIQSLAGVPPSDAAKFFLTQASFPIRVYSRSKLLAKCMSYSLAAMIGRFYRRQ